jgi:hypothetical protein
MAGTTKKRKAKASLPPPKKAKHGQRGSRAHFGGRKVTPIHGASEFRIWRVKDDEGKWQPSPARSKGLIDSRVHRYGRERGFKREDSGVDDIEKDARAKLVQAEMRSVPHNPLSHEQRIRMQGDFECFVLKAHGDNPFASYMCLKQLEETDIKQPQLKFQKPPAVIIESYVLHLRAASNDLGDDVPGRYNKHAAIVTRLGSISSTLIEFGIKKGLDKTWGTDDLLSQYEEEDVTSSAPSLELDKDLPKMYLAVFGGNAIGQYRKKVEFWSRLLLTIALLGRTSCTTKYTPLMTNTSLPEEAQDYLEDGSPRYVTVGMTGWKGRTKKCKRHKRIYYIRIYGNPKNLRYCVVHWVTKHWEVERQCTGTFPTGPIIRKLTERSFQSQLRKVFENAGLAHCSSHTLRRTAAQWARRCQADLFVIKNVGRWVSRLIVLAGNGHALFLFYFWQNILRAILDVQALLSTEKYGTKFGGRFLVSFYC